MRDPSQRARGRIGRPRTIETPELFDALVDQYVVECDATGDPICISGLVLYLGFNSRQSLCDYATRPGFENFADSVKRARMICEHELVRSAMLGGGAGPIFLLKASYGYEDKKTVDVNAKGDIVIQMTEQDAKL